MRERGREGKREKEREGEKKGGREGGREGRRERERERESNLTFYFLSSTIRKIILTLCTSSTLYTNRTTNIDLLFPHLARR